MKKHTSQSEIKSFQTCKRKWFYSYVRQLREKLYTPSALSQGTFYHEGVEHADGDWEAHLDGLFEREREKVDVIHHDALAEQVELAKILVSGFIEWAAETGLYADVEILAKEQQLAIDFENFVVMGKLDEVVQSVDGSVTIRDHKTAADFSIFKLAQWDLQLPSYQMLYNMSDLPGTATGAGWVVTKKNKRTARAKPPFYDTHRTAYNEHKMAATEMLWRSVMHTILGLEAAWKDTPGEFPQDALFPPSFSRDCSWCNFKDLCAMQDDGSRIEDHIEEWYNVSDPFERYTNVEINGHA